MTKESTRDAQFWQPYEEYVQCNLCHQNCRILPGRRGLCGVRENLDGKLMTLVYGNLIASSIDPIEKKPFFHFLPGSLAYSIATVGCNFRCLHCQNSDISQMSKGRGSIPNNFVPPKEVVDAAKDSGCQSIAYTYTEPTIFFEYAHDVARLALKAGLKNVFVSNGYMGEEAALNMVPILNGINIDLKGDEKFYREVCGASLAPVEHNIELFWKKGVWVEVTTLIIPKYNDSLKILRDLAEFLAGVSKDIPWHVSAFHPMYKMQNIPRTSVEALRRGVEIGRESGLNYVYAGNIPGRVKILFAIPANRCRSSA